MSEYVTTECPICGGTLAGRHCKLVCQNCGYREDCSDLFPNAACPMDAEEEGQPKPTSAADSPETPA